jgi:hypothetical protein
MKTSRITHGWSGSIRSFLDAPGSVIEHSLQDHIVGLFGHGASQSQINAWSEEVEIVKTTFRNLAISRQDCLNWSLIFEFELPLEGGRRPDVLLLGPGTLIVIEFKQDSQVNRAAVDQVAAYARDLSEYHSETHDLEVDAVLVPTRARGLNSKTDNVHSISPDLLTAKFDNLPSKEPISLAEWLDGDYAPLPTLIAAAKMIFNNERLPAIKRAESLGVARAVTALKEIASDAQEHSQRAMAFVSGVPGAGKTLVGLQFVHQESADHVNAVFLSGNGPLVDVLSGALRSNVFVKDLHSFIKTHGQTDKIPKQHIIVFDEAQRAWDAEHMNNKNQVSFSEPELLVGIGERIEGWATLVGLIGQGQEINTGEEAGISGWSDALESSQNGQSWHVYTPPRFTHEFRNQTVTVIPELDLTKSLRSRKAEDLHQWVENLLEGNVRLAALDAMKMSNDEFNVFITRDLATAKEYLHSRYEGHVDARYGILASAKDKTLPTYGILNGFMDTKRVKFRDWYNNPKGEINSCANLEEPMTEFGCQGLELDMALVAWGDDFLWDGSKWEMRKMRTRFPQKDPHTLRKNSYRVLLTRSRDGLIVFLPPLEKFDFTEMVLLAGGAKPLTSSIELPDAS